MKKKSSEEAELLAKKMIESLYPKRPTTVSIGVQFDCPVIPRIGEASDSIGKKIGPFIAQSASTRRGKTPPQLQSTEEEEKESSECSEWVFSNEIRSTSFFQIRK